MHRFHLAPLVTALAIAVVVAAEAKAAPPAAAATCHAADGFLVIEKERFDSVGSDFLIRRGDAPKPCTFVAKPGDVRLPVSRKVENAWYFLGMSGNRMALDEGTGSQNRTLVVVDLPTGKVVGSFRSFETARLDGGTAYVTVAKGRGSKETCPDLQQDLLPNARMVAETAIDLATLKAKPSDGLKCMYEE